MTEPGDRDEPVSSVRAMVMATLRGCENDLDALALVIRACVDLLPVDGASVSIMSGPQERETLYASDAIAARMEALQFSLGEGPCFEAFATRRPVLVPDLRQTSAVTWPVFAAEIADLPVDAVFAFPLQSGAISIGAVDLYRSRPGWLSAEELATALEVVDLATTVLLGMQLGTGQGWDSLPLHTEQVHQATGMVIAALGVTASEALARLRGYSFVKGRLVGDVSRDIVTRRLSPLELDR